MKRLAIAAFALPLFLAATLSFHQTPGAETAGTGPAVDVAAPSLVSGKVKVPVLVWGTVSDAYSGFNLHMRWDPAVFSFSSADATGGVFDPAAGTGSCVAPNTTAYDGDGGGVVNRDGKIDGLDLNSLGQSFLRAPSDPKYRPWADLNGDGAVNALDLNQLGKAFLQTVSGCIPCLPEKAMPARIEPNPRPNLQVGWDKSVGSRVGGVYSSILNYSNYGPWVKSGSAVVAWTMLLTSDKANYAQVGWLSAAWGRRYTFTRSERSRLFCSDRSTNRWRDAVPG